MANTETKTYQDYTTLPLMELKKIGGGSEIEVTTPWGKEIITTNEGYFFKTEKSAKDIVSELQSLQFEVKKYLYNTWLESVQNKNI